MKSRKRISIIANSNNASVNDINKRYADLILEYAQNSDSIIMNGGCNGIIEYINNKIEKNNIRNKIFSPAINDEEQKEIYKYTLNNLMCIYEHSDDYSLNYRFVDRSMKMIEESDWVFVFYGMWGTLSELTFATMFGKNIVFVVEEGRVQLLNVYNIVSTINNYNYNEKVYIVNTYEDMMKLLKDIL